MIGREGVVSTVGAMGRVRSADAIASTTVSGRGSGRCARFKRRRRAGLILFDPSLLLRLVRRLSSGRIDPGDVDAAGDGGMGARDISIPRRAPIASRGRTLGMTFFPAIRRRWSMRYSLVGHSADARGSLTPDHAISERNGFCLFHRLNRPPPPPPPRFSFTAHCPSGSLTCSARRSGILIV